MVRLSHCICALLVCIWFCPSYVGAAPFRVIEVVVDGPISPAQDEMLADALTFAVDTNANLMLVTLDTPGGLGESMRNMVGTMLNADIPVAVWVGPAGARAASAGVFLVAASSVAGMAEQTTIGAASPVGLGGEEISETMAAKVRNDFTALVRGVAESRGRNADWYGQAVTDSVSVTAAEAKELGVVEVVAETSAAFLAQAGQLGILHGEERIAFAPEDVTVERHRPGFRYDFLAWLLHPQIAYLLLMGGMLGLFIEITNPGSVLPGALGGVCLLLGLYAMSVLPTNIAGLLLIVFSLVLFMLEIKIVSYGLLSVAAIVAMFIGSIILFKDDYGSISVPMSFVVWPVAFMSAAMGGVVYLVAKAHSAQAALGDGSMVGLVGKALSWDGDEGQILVRGEIWAATASQSDFSPSAGQRVAVTKINGLRLEIEPVGRQPLGDNDSRTGE